MRLFITPADVWLFRGGLPFGEDATIKSDFPPTPETMQGAIRALIAAQWSGNMREAFDERFQQGALKRFIGDNNLVNGKPNYGRFRLHGYSLGMRNSAGNVEQLYPLPAHFVASKHDEGAGTHTVFLPSPKLEDQLPYYPAGMHSLNKQRNVQLTSEETGSEVSWVTRDSLRTLLGIIAEEDSQQAQRKPSIEVHGYSNGDLFSYEPRPGIGMERATRTTREGIFFQTHMVRPRSSATCQVGLGVDIRLAPNEDLKTCSSACAYRVTDPALAELKLPDRGWMTIGGERRPAMYEVIGDGDTPESPTTVQTNSGRTLLYFATPAYFTQGWLPGKKGEDGKVTPEWERVFGVVPVAAAIPRAQLIGGWRLEPGKAGGNAQSNAKSLRRYVPAGSVFFFDKPVSERGPYTENGFGREI